MPLIKIDSCQLDLSLGEAVISKLGECRYCHLRNHVERFRKDVPILLELAAMDSLRMSKFMFVGKHNGMNNKSSSPVFEKRLDSLDDCQKRNLIHFIKDYGRNKKAD